MEENRICPLLGNKPISEDDCYETCMIAEKYIKSSLLLEEIKNKKDFREICFSCKHHDSD